MPSESPFRRLSREVLVDNRWHRYCVDRYVQADGSEGRYYYVDMAGSAGIVPLFDDGSTVLVHAHRYLLGVELWEFPIGGMQPGDDPLDVARHELEEEAGLRAARWDRLGSFAPYKGVSNERCHFFVARDLSWTAQRLEPSEAMTVHRMPLAEARERLLGQELPDGQSLGGLLLLDRFLARDRLRTEGGRAAP
jgi:ADP-ribose pyrophosphatase